MATLKGTLSFVNREGTVTKRYTGSTNVTVSAADLGVADYEGTGAIKIEEGDNANVVSVSIDQAAMEAGKTVDTSTIGEIIGYLGGTVDAPA